MAGAVPERSELSATSDCSIPAASSVSPRFAFAAHTGVLPAASPSTFNDCSGFDSITFDNAIGPSAYQAQLIWSDASTQQGFMASLTQRRRNVRRVRCKRQRLRADYAFGFCPAVGCVTGALEHEGDRRFSKIVPVWRRSNTLKLWADVSIPARCADKDSS